MFLFPILFLGYTSNIDEKRIRSLKGQVLMVNGLFYLWLFQLSFCSGGCWSQSQKIIYTQFKEKKCLAFPYK